MGFKDTFKSPPDAPIIMEYPVGPEEAMPQSYILPGQHDNIHCSTRSSTLASLAILGDMDKGSVTKERLIAVLGEAIDEGNLSVGPDWEGLYQSGLDYLASKA